LSAEKSDTRQSLAQNLHWSERASAFYLDLRPEVLHTSKGWDKVPGKADLSKRLVDADDVFDQQIIWLNYCCGVISDNLDVEKDANLKLRGLAL
jgi:hypothetical protein